MIKPCGRAPSYSGKLRARAIELYRNGVKLGYINWADLQNTLAREFSSEFPEVSDNLPSPETVLRWVKKYPNAPEQLKQLRVQQADAKRILPQTILANTVQLYPMAAIPNRSTSNLNLNTLFGYLLPLMMIYFMAHCTAYTFSD
jgi:hypothetical protein